MNKSLEDLALITYGKDYKSNPNGDTFPIYGTGGLMGYTSVKLNSGPAILTGRKGSINKPFYIEGDFWHVDTIFCVKAKSGVNPKWLFYNLKNTDLNKLNEATGVPSVNTQSLYKLEFNYFNPDKQQKIAQILSTCDAVIEKNEAAIAKYQAMKKGLMHDLFTRGIDINTGKLRPKQEDAKHLYKESELGWIPKEWEVKRLEDFLEMKSGETITSDYIESSSEYPVYGGNGLRGYTNNYTHNGDYVLIGRQGALCGNVVIANKRFYASEHAIVVTILDKSCIFWLYEKLQYMNLNQYSEASAQPGLSVNKILKLKVSLPNDVEQKIISAKFSSINLRIQTEQSALSKYQQLKTGLMQDLLSGKVEVKV